MSRPYPMIASLLLAGLTGCSPQPQQHPEPPPVKDTAFGDMVGTMDKARGVEDTTMQHKKDLDKQLDATEGAAEQR